MKEIKVIRNKDLLCKIYRADNYRKGKFLYNCYIVKLYKKKGIFNKLVHISIFDQRFGKFPQFSKILLNETIDEYYRKNLIKNKERV